MLWYACPVHSFLLCELTSGNGRCERCQGSTRETRQTDVERRDDSSPVPTSAVWNDAVIYESWANRMLNGRLVLWMSVLFLTCSNKPKPPPPRRLDSALDKPLQANFVNNNRNNPNTSRSANNSNYNNSNSGNSNLRHSGGERDYRGSNNRDSNYNRDRWDWFWLIFWLIFCLCFVFGFSFLDLNRRRKCSILIRSWLRTTTCDQLPNRNSPPRFLPLRKSWSDTK